MSFPAPPVRPSLSPPPSSSSLPAKPESVSLPARPRMRSAPVSAALHLVEDGFLAFEEVAHAALSRKVFWNAIRKRSLRIRLGPVSADARRAR